MDKIIKNILMQIEEQGFEAYLVGGFVRDYLLGIKSFDVDICTNALPKDLHKIFLNNTESNSYGGFNFQVKKYNIDITTYRQELSYEKRKPTEILYINDLEEDIKRRDFTINSVVMDKNENIKDLVGGIKDINNKNIRMLGDISKRLKEDPLRILRAIRFATVLDFNLDADLKKEIKVNYQLVNTLSKMRIKQELDKILLHKNYLKGLTLLKEFQILDLLNISYKEITYVSDLGGMWAQLQTGENIAFTKQELKNIISIRAIVEEENITAKTLYKYGLYNTLVAGKILNISEKEINRIYEGMQVKSIKDLAITNEEIFTLLNISPSKIVKDIKNELVELILDDKLENKKAILKEYILKRKER